MLASILLLLGGVVLSPNCCHAQLLEGLEQLHELVQLGSEGGLNEFGGRQIYLNSTSSILSIIAIGGVAILLVAVALYLYDFAATERQDQYNQNYYAAPYGQYGQYGYNGYNKQKR